MIYLLKRLRKNVDGKGTSKHYFIYAIGELILVVLGIVIAFQIDNWNEDKKNRLFEKEILSQIEFNLEKDKKALLRISKNSHEAVKASKKILEFKKGDPSDSLHYWLGSAIQFDRFSSLTNGYEVLKSRGLHYIRDKELRFLLGEYYDDVVKNITEIFKDVENSFMDYWLPLINANVDSMKFKRYIRLDNYEPLFVKSIERNTLTMNVDNYMGCVYASDRSVVVIDKILELIRADLKRK